MQKRLLYVALGAVLVLLAAAAASRVPFTYPEGDFVLNMIQAAHAGHVATTFLPGFYPWLAAQFYRPLGIAGVLVLQAALYLAIPVLLFLVLRRASGYPRGAAVAVFVIALDPDLLFSIAKLWDTEITVFFVCALLLLCLCFRAGSYAALWTAAVVWGLSLALRPNFALLALPLGYALFHAYRRRAAVWAVALVAVAFLTMAGTNTLVHGAFYLPGNGPYNLFAGANRYTQGALLHSENAEPSVAPALAALGDSPAVADTRTAAKALIEKYADDPIVHREVAAHGEDAVVASAHLDPLYSLTLRPLYTRLAWSFIVHHPLQWAWLGAVKLFTLLRPDLKAHRAASGQGLMKLATSFCSLVWLGCLVLLRRRGTARLAFADKLLLAFLFAYTLPFVLTNADPRFRVALDVLFLTHAALILLRHFAARRGAMAAAPASVAAS